MCEEVPMTIQFDEDKKWLWELARSTFKRHTSNIRAMKTNPMHHKMTFWGEKQNVVEYNHFHLLQDLNHKLLGPHVWLFKKKISYICKLELSKILELHPIFHVFYFEASHLWSLEAWSKTWVKASFQLILWQWIGIWGRSHVQVKAIVGVWIGESS